MQIKMRPAMRFPRILPALLLCLLAATPLFAQNASDEGGGILPLNRPSPFRRAPEMNTPEDVLRFLVQHRRDAALASVSLLPDGRIDFRDPVLAMNAETPFPLASTRKILHLAAFASAVAEGRLNPNEKITVAEWERFYLPGSDGGAHGAALAYLEIPADEYGFAVAPQTQVTLGQLADVMIRFSDNAAPDWFLERLGPAVNAVIERARLRGQERLYFGLGEFLLIENHEAGLLTPARASLLAVKSRADIIAEANRLAEAYQSPAWREAELLWRLANQNELGNYAGYALMANTISPKGTAADFAQIMAEVLTGRFLSPQTSALMRTILEWPMDFADQIPFFAVRDRLATWGEKGGTLNGLQTQANYFIPKTGPFAGKGRVVVLFLRNLPEASFNQLSITGADIHFALRLGVERDFAQRVARALPRGIIF